MVATQPTLEKKSLMSQPPIDPKPEQPEQNAPSSEQSAPEAPQAPQAPQPPQAPQFSAPSAPPQPPAAPPAPQFSAPPAPQQPSYAPQPQHFAPPQQPAPAAPQQQAPQQPAPPQFTPPAPPAPQAPQYAAPQQPGLGQPAAAPQYGAPQYAAPQPQYGAPAYGAQPVFPPAPLGTVPGPGGPFDGALDPEDLSRPLYGASFSQAAKRFLKGYAKFNGRASRSEYWWVMLLVFLVELVPLVLIILGGIIMATSSGYDPVTYESTPPNGAGVALLIAGYGLLLLIGLAILVPSIAIAWRRLHDGNFAGPLYFLSLVPYVGGIILIVFMLLPSKAEGRRFDAANL